MGSAFDRLTDAVCFARGGIQAGRRHGSDQRMGRHVFLADIGRYLVQAGLPVKRWDTHDWGGGASLYYEIAHALASAVGLSLPRSLKRPAAQAMQIAYEMSPVMKAAQGAGLVAWRQRLDGLALRLKAVAPHQVHQRPHDSSEKVVQLEGRPAP